MAGLTAELEVLDESVEDSVLVEPAPEDSVPVVLVELVLVESVLVDPVLVDPVPASVVVSVLPVVPVESVLPVVVVLDESELDTLVASVSAHSCRPSADAAITAATPIVPVMIALSLLPRSCRFIPCRLPCRVSDEYRLRAGAMRRL